MRRRIIRKKVVNALHIQRQKDINSYRRNIIQADVHLDLEKNPQTRRNLLDSIKQWNNRIKELEKLR